MEKDLQMVQRVTYKIGDEELILETGRLAKQANGAVYAQFGGSAVIATACASGTAQEGLDFVPHNHNFRFHYIINEILCQEKSLKEEKCATKARKSK